MYDVFFLNGGTGRVVSALPALELYAQTHDEFYIVCESGLDVFFGHPILQDKAFDVNHKGLFESIIKDGRIITTEPYRDHDYYNQRCSISQAFDKQINGHDEIRALAKPKIYLNKDEELHGIATIQTAKKNHGKEKTIVIQPYGRGAGNTQDLNIVADQGTRSIEQSDYLKLAERLKKSYNVLCMSEFPTPGDTFSVHPKNLDLRKWSAVIELCDYFIGCDSVGQHFAYAFDIPGTVVLGSTYAINVSYPDHFNIWEKPGFQKTYSPIRISDFNNHMADRKNDQALSLSDDEFEKLYTSIENHIKQAIK
jgi:hypothetical protein